MKTTSFSTDIDIRSMGRLLFYITLFLVCLHGDSAQTSYDRESELRTLLQTNYSSVVRPNSTTEVHASLNLRTLLNLDISKETVEITGWMSFVSGEQNVKNVGQAFLVWYDPRLRWTAASYDGISALDVNWAWTPTFAITNVIKDFTFYGGPGTSSRVHSSGVVRWDVPLIQTTSCSVDIMLFPFDTQTCYIEGILWRSDSSEISLLVQEYDVSLYNYIPNGEWDLTATGSSENGAVPLCCPVDLAPRFNYSLTFKRKRPYYVTNLLLPTLMMSVCIVWTFILPIESGERIGYSITIMLTYTVLLTLTSGFLPTTSTQTPFIASFIIIILMFSLGAVALTVLNVKLFNMEGCPTGLVQTIFRYLGYVVFCQCKCRKLYQDRVMPVPRELHNLDDVKNQDHTNHDVTSEKTRPVTSEPDVCKNTEELSEISWKQISEVLDRIFFYIYMLAIAIFDILLIAALNGAQISPMQF